MDFVGPDLLHIVTLASRVGRSAVIDGQCVAIFTQLEHDTEEGMRYVSYRVNRVRTFAEALGVLPSSTTTCGAVGNDKGPVSIMRSATSTTSATDRSPC